MTLNADALKVATTEVEPCRYELEISIPANDVETAVGTVTREWQRSANVPGFRRGKVPVRLLQKRFGKHIFEEARKNLVQEALPLGMEKADLRPATVPQFVGEDLDELLINAEFTFKVSFDSEPSFELPPLDGMKLKVPLVEVTDDDVSQFIGQLRQQRAALIRVEEPAADSDVAKISYSSKLEGDEDVPPTAQPLLNASEQWVTVGPDGPLPGVGEALIGASPGDQKAVTVTFPDDFADPFLQGRTINYDIDLLEVHRMVPAALDDEFAKAVGADGVDDLQNGVRHMLEERFAGQRRQLIEGMIARQLIQRADFSVPPTLVAGQAKSLAMERAAADMRDHGKAVDQIREDIDSYLNGALDDAREALKLRYMISAIAREVEYEPEQNEIDEVVAYLRSNHQRQRGSGDFDAEEAMQSAYHYLLRDHVMGNLLARAEVEDVSVEEFQATVAAEMAEAQAAHHHDHDCGHDHHHDHDCGHDHHHDHDHDCGHDHHHDHDHDGGHDHPADATAAAEEPEKTDG